MEKKRLDKELKLKVAEAIQDDVNKGIVRIDNSFMQQIGARVGDIVEIEGERKTVAITDRAYPGDIGLNIIRMDGIVTLTEFEKISGIKWTQCLCNGFVSSKYL